MGLVGVVIVFYVAWFVRAMFTVGDKLLEFLPVVLLVGFLLPLTGMYYVPATFGTLVEGAEWLSKVYGEEKVRRVEPARCVRCVGLDGGWEMMN